jgi:hypothetical protein
MVGTQKRREGGCTQAFRLGYSFHSRISFRHPKARRSPRNCRNRVSANFYDIDARADGNPTKEQMRVMMQSLLADRFKLKVHFETGEASGVCADFGEAGQEGAGAASTLRRNALPPNPLSTRRRAS